MDNHSGSVARRTERQIEQLAAMVRRELGVGPGDRIAMQPLFEFALDDMVEGAFFSIVPDTDMPGAEGRTDWHQPCVTFAASTWSALERAAPRARMTAAHELGHLLMHTQRPVFHYRSRSKDRRVDPEWQARYFAAALLMPADAFKKMRKVSQVRKAFGVSRHAALVRARVLKHELIDDSASSAKRKGSSKRQIP